MGGAGTKIMGETRGETSVCIPVIPRPVRGSVCIFILLVADWVVKVSSDSGNKPTDDLLSLAARPSLLSIVTAVWGYDLLPPLPIGGNWPGFVPTEDDQPSTTWSTTSVVFCAILFVAVVVLVTAAIMIAAVYSER